MESVPARRPRHDLRPGPAPAGAGGRTRSSSPATPRRAPAVCSRPPCSADGYVTEVVFERRPPGEPSHRAIGAAMLAYVFWHWPRARCVGRGVRGPAAPVPRGAQGRAVAGVPGLALRRARGRALGGRRRGGLRGLVSAGWIGRARSAQRRGGHRLAAGARTMPPPPRRKAARPDSTSSASASSAMRRAWPRGSASRPG